MLCEHRTIMPKAMQKHEQCCDNVPWHAHAQGEGTPAPLMVAPLHLHVNAAAGGNRRIALPQVTLVLARHCARSERCTRANTEQESRLAWLGCNRNFQDVMSHACRGPCPFVLEYGGLQPVQQQQQLRLEAEQAAAAQQQEAAAQQNQMPQHQATAPSHAPPPRQPQMHPSR
jgi:hypothetical protein